MVLVTGSGKLCSRTLQNDVPVTVVFADGFLLLMCRCRSWCSVNMVVLKIEKIVLTAVPLVCNVSSVTVLDVAVTVLNAAVLGLVN